MIDFGGGLWLAVFVQTATSTVASTAQVYIASTGITLSGEDGTKGVFVGGVMAGAGYPGSYVPTGGATASRAADSVTIPVANFPFSATAGTILVAARTPQQQDGVVRHVFAIDDGSENNRIIGYRDASNAVFVEVTVGGVQQAAINVGTVAPDTDFKLAMRYRADDMAASLNGAAVVTDTSATVPSVTTLRVGRRFSTGEWNSTVRQLAVIDRGLSNAELQAAAA
jgi:hypothetical protein